MGENSQPLVTLNVDNEPVINLCGIQPLLSEGGFVRDSHIIFTGRMTSVPIVPKQRYRFHHEVKVAYRRRFEIENEIITNNTVGARDIEKDIISKMWNYGKHYRWEKRIEDMNIREMMSVLVKRSQYIRLTTFGLIGNFIMFSNKTVFDKVASRMQSGIYKLVCVGEELLPKNVIIVGSSSENVYANPLVACPIIPKEDLEQFCLDNALDTDLIVFDKSKQYPFLNMMLDWYEIYDLYLRHVGTNKWYLQEFNDFNTIQDYYSVIHFQEQA